MADSPSLANNTIALSKILPEQYDEGVVGPSYTIYPGQLVSLVGGSGPQETLQYRPIDGGVTASLIPEKNFAIENVYHGKSITDSYSAGQNFSMVYLRTGDIVLSKVTDLTASSGDLLRGLYLTANSDGWLKTVIVTSFPTTEPFPVGISLEVELSASLPRWTRVRIL